MTAYSKQGRYCGSFKAITTTTIAAAAVNRCYNGLLPIRISG